MKTAIALLKSVSPYEQSRFHNTPKLDKEGPDAYERRTWRNKMHSSPEGFVFIPPTAFKNCLASCAKYLSLPVPGKGKATYTKNFKSGVLVTDGLVTRTKVDAVPETWLHLNADGVSGSGKRVLRCMPVIQEWSGPVTFYVADETITEDVFRKVLEEAGKFIGIGTFRPQNGGFFGRFSVEKLDWK